MREEAYYMENDSKKKYPVKRMVISINMKKTGANIRRSIMESGYTMREIMEITGITAEQTIYKWYSGKSIPSLETQIILCKLLDLQITELLVLEGEFRVFSACAGSVFPVKMTGNVSLSIRNVISGRSCYLFPPPSVSHRSGVSPLP